jgi:23S rRNA (uridine2479-2'-O)-methyltransferase
VIVTASAVGHNSAGARHAPRDRRNDEPARAEAGQVSPKTVRIYSANNDYQYVEALRRNREKRHRNREFFLEGVRPINQALAAAWRIRAFLFSRERQRSEWAEKVLAESPAETHYELPASLFDTLSRKQEPSELLAIVAMPADDLGRIRIHHGLRVVVFDRPASPGNLGTLVRSCDCFQVDGLVLAGHGVDLYDPDTISATTGSFFALPIVRVGGPPDLRTWLAELRERLPDLAVVGSSAKATSELATHDFGRPTVLVIGNETRGMSGPFRELCEEIVQIPIAGSATSLNVACAATVLLYELDRQRRLAATGEAVRPPK